MILQCHLVRRHRDQHETPAASGFGVAWMQSMDAYRIEMSELRRDMRELQVGVRELQVGLVRMDGRLDTMQERIEKVLEKGLREQTRFFFLAWSVILAAIIGLYARP